METNRPGPSISGAFTGQILMLNNVESKVEIAETRHAFVGFEADNPKTKTDYKVIISSVVILHVHRK